MKPLSKLLLALILAAAWQLTPPAAKPAAAACSGSYCATLEMVPGSGAGAGYMSTFPGGIDCESTSSASGSSM